MKKICNQYNTIQVLSFLITGMEFSTNIVTLWVKLNLPHKTIKIQM